MNREAPVPFQYLTQDHAGGRCRGGHLRIAEACQPEMIGLPLAQRTRFLDQYCCVVGAIKRCQICRTGEKRAFVTLQKIAGYLVGILASFWLFQRLIASSPV